jgi:hypothetical protein
MKKVCCILSIICFFSLISSANTNSLVNPFTTSGNWYKASLHTHTSDANVALRVKQFRDRGYQVLALTDKDRTNKIDGFSDSNFLLLNGMEIYTKSNEEEPYHFLCLNIPENFKFTADANANEQIRQVKAAGGQIIYAHPYWSAHNINDMLAIDGYIAIEVYNSSFHYTGRGYSSVNWDQLLNTGRIIPAIAADDLHKIAYIAQSWTMIKAKELTPAAIMDALRTGSCYSSCGPAFEDFQIKDGKAEVKCSPVVEISFLGNTNLSRSVTADPNHLITSAEYKLPEKIKWVRAEIVDANGKHAWTNPIVIEKLNRN